MKIKKEARLLVLFMALGDGSINTQGYLSIRHCLAQKEYAEWKRQLLNKNGVKTTPLYEVSNNGYGAVEFRTKTYKFIKSWRRFIYRPCKKIADKRVMKMLTPLGLSIWYMDDGGISQKKENGVITANDLMLNTALSKEENQVLIDAFLNCFDIKFTQCKNRGKYRLRCGTKEARKFIEIVKPYVNQVNCMKYKLNVKS